MKKTELPNSIRFGQIKRGERFLRNSVRWVRLTHGGFAIQEALIGEPRVGWPIEMGEIVQHLRNET